MKLNLVSTEERERREQELIEIQKQREIEAQNAANERARKLNILNKKRKNQRLLVSIIAGSILLLILVFGVYNTFFKKNLSEVDVQNVVHNTVAVFPTGGLEGYLKNNFEDWFKENSNILSDDVESVSPKKDTLTITKVETINSYLANVYFKIDLEINTLTGDTVDSEIKNYSFYIPVNYFIKKNGTTGFSPSDKLSICDLQDKSISEIHQSVLLVFDEDSKEDAKLTESAKIKAQKILEDLYAGRDISQDYTFAYKIKKTGSKINSIDSFTLYKKPNDLGFNSVIEYTLETKEGFSYRNKNYLYMEQSGKSWIITKIQ